MILTPGTDLLEMFFLLFLGENIEIYAFYYRIFMLDTGVLILMICAFCDVYLSDRQRNCELLKIES